MSKTTPEKNLRRLLVGKLAELTPTLTDQNASDQARQKAWVALRRIVDIADALNQVDCRCSASSRWKPLSIARSKAISAYVDQVRLPLSIAERTRQVLERNPAAMNAFTKSIGDRKEATAEDLEAVIWALGESAAS